MEMKKKSANCVSNWNWHLQNIESKSCSKSKILQILLAPWDFFDWNQLWFVAVTFSPRQSSVNSVSFFFATRSNDQIRVNGQLLIFVTLKSHFSHQAATIEAANHCELALKKKLIICKRLLLIRYKYVYARVSLKHRVLLQFAEHFYDGSNQLFWWGFFFANNMLLHNPPRITMIIINRVNRPLLILFLLLPFFSSRRFSNKGLSRQQNQKST